MTVLIIVVALTYITLAEIRDWLEPTRFQHDLRRIATAVRCGHPEEAEAICRRYRFRPALHRRALEEAAER